MIFDFLKYLSPTWYFNLKPNLFSSYFPTPDQIKKRGLRLRVDGKYISKEGTERDLAYRAFQCGLILSNQDRLEGINIWESIKLPAQDEYRFIRKNFNPIWVFYVLCIRLITLHNPIKEVLGYINSRDARRENYKQNHFQFSSYKYFESSLICQKPFVSIIIPTLNRYKYLKKVFHDLENQTYKNFEVIVVDQTDPFDENVYKGWDFNLKYWYQKEKALWKARNDAIKVSQGDYVLLYDDDSLVEANWIEEHLKTLDFFQADLSSGVSLSTVGGKIPAHYSFFRWSDQIDTGNVLIKKSVFLKSGLFDRQFEKQRMGDAEFGMRTYLAGFKNISNPYAKRIHLKVKEGGLRQMGSWDAFRPKNIFSPKPIPSVLYYYRKYFGTKPAVFALLKNIPPSIIPYRFKRNTFLLALGSMVSFFLLPFTLIQIIISWKESSRRLREGALIDKFEENTTYNL